MTDDLRALLLEAARWFLDYEPIHNHAFGETCGACSFEMRLRAAAEALPAEREGAEGPVAFECPEHGLFYTNGRTHPLGKGSPTYNTVAGHDGAFIACRGRLIPLRADTVQAAPGADVAGPQPGCARHGSDDPNHSCDSWPAKRGHCSKCGKAMQFADGICFDCNGGRDPGD